MSQVEALQGFKQLVDAEDYFSYFNLPFDPQMLAVNRLHILRHFADQLVAIDSKTTSAEERHQRYREALELSYRTFLSSSAVDQKLFAVFQKKPGHIVKLEDVMP